MMEILFYGNFIYYCKCYGCFLTVDDGLFLIQLYLKYLVWYLVVSYSSCYRVLN